MFGGLGGMNPAKMKAMMKQMGIDMKDVDAQRVIIEKTDGNKIIIENPSVQKITAQGQESWQISGDAREEADTGVKESDILLVMEKTGKNKEEAIKALEKANGDIAEAILELSE